MWDDSPEIEMISMKNSQGVPCYTEYHHSLRNDTDTTYKRERYWIARFKLSYDDRGFIFYNIATESMVFVDEKPELLLEF